jgi:hypothetical protein
MGDYPPLAQSAFDKFERAKTMSMSWISGSRLVGRSHLMRVEFYLSSKRPATTFGR